MHPLPSFPIHGSVYVGQFTEKGDSQAACAGAAHGFGEHRIRAPRHRGEEARLWRAQADEPIAAVQRGAEHDVVTFQLRPSVLNIHRGHFGAVRANDDDLFRIGTKVFGEGGVKAFPQIALGLRARGPVPTEPRMDVLLRVRRGEAEFHGTQWSETRE